ncbi:CHAP domain-containing protein [Azospirillum sp. TSO5]|uniref:CHAP domain-containing protein n=1 Tax=Azospirillum sp. TSO5 TaxID=716760 RepID=UPI001304C842|nr:CHAP domain-containing protein [Azospirillum sp. TSO5]
MISRRAFTIAAATLPVLNAAKVWAIEEGAPVAELDDLTYPSFDIINPVNQFGRAEPDEQQKEKAKRIWTAAPKGPRPIDVVNYFIDNFNQADPEAISQWPNAEAWNPLVVEFFRSTNYKAENDLVPWCAAFANWCLKRTNRIASGSAASQSFLDPQAYAFTNNPKIGDLAVFTCYNIDTGKSIGLGHVAFVAGIPTATQILVAGGNQSNDGRSMICRRTYPLGPVRTSRTVNGKRTPVDFKINTYISIT